jgi:hypothetical protein
VTSADLAQIFVYLDNASASQLRRRVMACVIRAELACWLGRPAEALPQLRRASELGLLDVAWLDECRLIEPIRDSDVFQTVRDEVLERVAAVERELAHVLTREASKSLGVISSRAP